MQNKNCCKKAPPKDQSSCQSSAQSSKAICGLNPPGGSTICLVAGGSGGHITPALVLADRWKSENPNGSILFFGCTKKLDQSILENVECKWLKLSNLPGKKFWRYPHFLAQFSISFLKSFWTLRKHKPRKIISTGGLIALPVCAAGKLLSIPIELYELNAIPGKAIKLLSFFARDIFVTFEKSTQFFHDKCKKKCSVTAYPLRFTQSDKFGDKKKIIEKINETMSPTTQFSIEHKTIFLLGGSQGSVFLNGLLREWVDDRENTGIQIIHQTGSNDPTDWKKFYTTHNIPAHIFTYTPDIKDFYLLCDLVISRAGAGTLFELEFFEKRSVLVPLKNHAGGHQVANAHEMVRRHPELFSIYDLLTIPLEQNLLNLFER